MKQIVRPHIYRHGEFLEEHTRLLVNFQETYNSDKESGEEMLKGTHIGLLDDLIYYAHLSLNRENKAVDNVPELTATQHTWIKVNLNKYREKDNKHRLCTERTIRRYKARLIESGAISDDPAKFAELGLNKRRTDLLINPDLLLIYDAANPDYQPTTKYFSETDLQAIREKKRTVCPPVQDKVPEREHLNNSISDVQDVEKGVSHPLNQTDDKEQETLTGTQKKQAPSDDSPPQIEQNCAKNEEKTADRPEKSKVPPKFQPVDTGFFKENIEKHYNQFGLSLADDADQLTKWRRKYALRLYLLMLDVVFNQHDINDVQAQKAIRYLESTGGYFGSPRTEAEFEARFSEWQESLAMVQNFIQNHDYDTRFLFPMKYIATENENGLYATKKWRENKAHLQAVRKAEIERKKREIQEDKVLKKAVSFMTETPTTANFLRCRNWFRENCPHLLDAFMNEIQDIINHLTA